MYVLLCMCMNVYLYMLGTRLIGLCVGRRRVPMVRLEVESSRHPPSDRAVRRRRVLAPAPWPLAVELILACLARRAVHVEGRRGPADEVRGGRVTWRSRPCVASVGGAVREGVGEGRGGGVEVRAERQRRRAVDHVASTARLMSCETNAETAPEPLRGDGLCPSPSTVVVCDGVWWRGGRASTTDRCSEE